MLDNIKNSTQVEKKSAHHTCALKLLNITTDAYYPSKKKSSHDDG